MIVLLPVISVYYLWSHLLLYRSYVLFDIIAVLMISCNLLFSILLPFLQFYYIIITSYYDDNEPLILLLQ